MGTKYFCAQCDSLKSINFKAASNLLEMFIGEGPSEHVLDERLDVLHADDLVAVVLHSNDLKLRRGRIEFDSGQATL